MPTIRQKKAFKRTLENGGVVSTAMLESDYSPAMAKNPQKLTTSKGWLELVEHHLGDSVLAEKHAELLNSSHLDHMNFPTGPKNEQEKEEYIAKARQKADEAGKEYEETEYLSDDEIKQMLSEVNCKVRRIVHRETARDVYFWSADNKSRKDALDMAYKLKGNYAPDKHININTNVSIEHRERANNALRHLKG